MDVYGFRLANYLRLKKEKAGGVTKKFAELVGTSPDYLSGIEGNLQDKKIGAKLARKIEKACKLPRGWMDQDHRGLENANTEAPGREVYWLPKISWVRAGRFNGIEVRESYADHNMIATTRPVSKRAYALRVRGDSMTAPGGISFPDGCWIIVDPAIEPKPGSPVVVRLDGVDEATFKELAIDAGRLFLKPLNPRYPVMPLPENAEIIGVAVEIVIEL